jgi:multiple sugar transport system permease protein
MAQDVTTRARARDATYGRQGGLLSALENEAVLGFLLLLPALALLLIFVAYPLAYGVYLSFTDTVVAQRETGNFIGFRNYATLLNDSIFRTTVLNSFNYTFWTTVFKFVGGLALAVLLNNEFRGRRFVRAALLLPWIVPTVLSTLAWLWMFDSTFSVFNWILREVSEPFLGRRNAWQGPNWLGDSPWPMISLMLVNIWRGLPFFAVSFLAGMQGISQEYYEAATIDGANAWQRFRKITLPLLRPVIAVVLLLSIILTLADFQLIYVLTRGGPADSTHVFSTYAFQTAIPAGQLGMGAAISVFMFPFLAVIVFFTLLSIRKEDR